MWPALLELRIFDVNEPGGFEAERRRSRFGVVVLCGEGPLHGGYGGIISLPQVVAYLQINIGGMVVDGDGVLLMFG